MMVENKLNTKVKERTIEQIDQYIVRHYNREIEAPIYIDLGLIYINANYKISHKRLGKARCLDRHEGYTNSSGIICSNTDEDESKKFKDKIPTGKYYAKIVAYNWKLEGAMYLEIYFKTTTGLTFRKTLYGALACNDDLSKIIKVGNRGEIPKKIIGFNEIVLGKYVVVNIWQQDEKYTGLRSGEFLLEQLNQKQMNEKYKIYKEADDSFTKLNEEYSDETIEDMIYGYDKHSRDYGLVDVNLDFFKSKIDLDYVEEDRDISELD